MHNIYGCRNVDFQADVADKTWTETGADVSQNDMVA